MILTYEYRKKVCVLVKRTAFHVHLADNKYLPHVSTPASSITKKQGCAFYFYMFLKTVPVTPFFYLLQL